MTTPSTKAGTAVTSSRISRLARLGSLASGVAGGMLAEGLRQLAQGRRPSVGELLLTPANARRVADQLAQLRGAAMKVGQLLSMDAGDLLPPELSQILARLRADAQPMPMSQLVTVLEANWGKDWTQHFSRFSFTPMAAASIGQVHAAEALDGRRLAIKVQYPGIARSIASDVDNVATLLRISGLLDPAGATIELMQMLERAGPFGQAAPAPRFAFAGQLIDSAGAMGDSHLRLRFRSPGSPVLEAVAWGAMSGPLGPALLGAKGRRFHLAGKLELSQWGGRERVRLRLDDAAPAE